MGLNIYAVVAKGTHTRSQRPFAASFLVAAKGPFEANWKVEYEWDLGGIDGLDLTATPIEEATAFLLAYDGAIPIRK